MTVFQGSANFGGSANVSVSTLAKFFIRASFAGRSTVSIRTLDIRVGSAYPELLAENRDRQQAEKSARKARYAAYRVIQQG